MGAPPFCPTHCRTQFQQQVARNRMINVDNLTILGRQPSKWKLREEGSMCYQHTSLEWSFHLPKVGNGERTAQVMLQMPQTLAVLIKFQIIFLNICFFIYSLPTEPSLDVLNDWVIFIISPVLLGYKSWSSSHHHAQSETTKIKS